MRSLVAIVVFAAASHAFAAPSVFRASAVPEPGLLVALGGGLVGIAAIIRRRLGQ